MGIFDELFSAQDMISEQVLRELESVLPAEDCIFAIIDNHGEVWTNDQENYDKYFSDNSHLQRLCCRLDDGSECVLSHTSDCSVVMTDVVLDNRLSGYTMLAMPGRSPVDIISSIDIYEFALRQVALIASLIQKNNIIHHEKLSRPLKMETHKVS